MQCHWHDHSYSHIPVRLSAKAIELSGSYPFFFMGFSAAIFLSFSFRIHTSFSFFSLSCVCICAQCDRVCVCVCYYVEVSVCRSAFFGSLPSYMDSLAAAHTRYNFPFVHITAHLLRTIPMNDHYVYQFSIWTLHRIYTFYCYLYACFYLSSEWCRSLCVRLFFHCSVVHFLSCGDFV